MDNSNQSRLLSCERLTYKTIQEGMVLLGRVYQVHNASISVSLPGRLFGQVFIRNISTKYSEVLEDAVKNNNINSTTLHDMFHEGQFVITKVSEVFSYNTIHPIILTLDPKDVYENFSHSWFTEDAIISVSIKQIEDHGYIVDCGVDKCRCFLPFEESDQKYSLGQVVLAKITKCQKQSGLSTLIVTNKSEKLNEKSIPKYSAFSNICAGMLVEFSVKEFVQNGLEGTFLDDNCIGYISESHLEKSVKSLHKYKAGQKLLARVLYTLPLVKVTFLTLMKFEVNLNEKKPSKIGSIVDSQILKRVKNGYYLDVKDSDIGFVSFKRLGINIKNLKDDLSDKLSENFKIKSRKVCRIVDYNFMERVYICSFEQSLCSTDVFTLEDLRVGQKVQCVIEQVYETGVLVSVERVKGMIANAHLSDFSAANKNKFKVGKSITARVLEINVEVRGLVLTAKPSLVDTELPLLCDLKDVEEGLNTIGFIVNIEQNGLLVAFFGNIKGFMHRKRLRIPKEDDLDNHFFLGQVIECVVLNHDENFENMQLGPNVILAKRKPIKVGTSLDVCVVEKNKDGLWVESEPGSNFFLSKFHCSRHANLADAFLKAYNVGDTIPNVHYIYMDDDIYYLSAIVGNFQSAIARNSIVISFVDKIEENHLTVYLFDTWKKLTFTVEFNNAKAANLNQHQVVLVEIIDVAKKSAKIAERKSVKGFDYGVPFLENYLQDVEKLSKLNTELSRQYQTNKTYRGKLTKFFDDGSCEFIFENNVRGIALNGHTKRNVIVGLDIDCFVLWIDYPTNTLIVTTCKQHLIDKKQDPEKVLKLESFYNSEILISTKNFKLATLKGQGQGQLVFLLSSIVTENDYFLAPVNELPEKRTTNILVKRIEGSKALGVLRIYAINKLKSEKRKLSQTRKRKSTEYVDEPVENRTKKPKIQLKVNAEITDHETQTQIVPELAGPKDFWNLNDEDLFSCDESDSVASDIEDGDASASVQATDAKKQKLSSQKKKKIVQKEEERLRRIENEMISEDFVPKTIADFERLVMKNPDDSINWIKFISFQLDNMETEKARSTARRAISKINYRKENEKLNIWIALLNLENEYGTEETFMSVLVEAAQSCDAFKVYSKAVQILKNSQKEELAKKLLEKQNRLAREVEVRDKFLEIKKNKIQRKKEKLRDRKKQKSAK